jgi:AraC-like DNA-binding protein/mannose-6-phosphate isomerase-like protein (cupin superfamily)
MHISRALWRNADRGGSPIVNAEGVYLCDFDPSFPIEVGFEIHDSHHNVRMNRHESFEVVYVYGGDGYLQVQDRRFRMFKGNVALVGPNLYHQFLSGPTTKLKLSFLHFQSQILLGSTSGEEEQYLAPFLCQDVRFPHVISAFTRIPDQVLPLILKIHSELPPRNEVSRLTVKTYLKMVLLLLLRHYHKYLGTHEALERRRQDMRRIDPLFHFIDQHYHQSIRIPTAAHLCAMSEVQFVRFFRRITGQSLGNYLKRFRVAKAQSLLSATDETIADISALLGFCSQSHFGAAFRSLVGLTPLAYRRRYGRNLNVNVGRSSTQTYSGPSPTLSESQLGC